MVRPIVAALVCALAQLAQGQAQPKAAKGVPQVDLPQGAIVGREISLVRTQRIFGYLGIPYAQPPEESLRFAPPAVDPLPSWKGVRNASEFAPACMQSTEEMRNAQPFLGLLSDEENLEVNEDCLYLNVFVPYGSPPEEGYSVIVWIHPGNFSYGNVKMWNPYALVFKQRVIVVTIAYRLNVMGFFTTMDGEAPGNFGLMDQVAALSWINDNIKHFNGNPNSITLLGYGAGANSVGIHMISPQSKGLFTKAIAMSGNVASQSSVYYPSDYKPVVDNMASYFACYRKPTSRLLECLRRADASALLSLASSVHWKPIVDAGLSNGTPSIIPEHPRSLLERGEFNKVPFMTGYTDMELALSLDELNPSADEPEKSGESLNNILTEFVNRGIPYASENDTCTYNHDHMLESVMFVYRPLPPPKGIDGIRRTLIDMTTEREYGASTYLLAKLVSKHKPTYVYRFDMKPSTAAATDELPAWASVPHFFDLIFVWGMPFWLKLKEAVEWDSTDKRSADIIMGFWANFAKWSDPAERSAYPIPWDNFTAEDPRILIIDRRFNMSDTSHLNHKAFEFWNEFYPRVVEIATQCCNATESAGRAARPAGTIAPLIFLVMFLLSNHEF